MKGEVKNIEQLYFMFLAFNQHLRTRPEQSKDKKNSNEKDNKKVVI